MRKLSLVKVTSLVVAMAFAAIMTGCASVGGGADAVEAASADVAADVNRERTILAAINDDPGLNGQNIGVSCTNGVVTLRGTVQSSLERQLAEKIAAKVDGVTEVRNLLTFS